MIGTLLLIISVLTFLYVKKKHQYFSDKGIPSAPGYFPLGSSIIWKCFTGQQSILQVAEDLNDDFPKSKAFGFYKSFGEPVLVLKVIFIMTYINFYTTTSSLIGFRFGKKNYGQRF